MAQSASDDSSTKAGTESGPASVHYDSASAGPTYLQQSPAKVVEPYGPDTDNFGLGDGYVTELRPYPDPCPPGMRTPLDLWRYAGCGQSSWGTPELPMLFDEWLEFHRKQTPDLMAEVRAYMNSRYDFHGEPIPGVYMSGGRKPVPAGPVARLPDGIESFEELSALSPEEIKERDLFPPAPKLGPLMKLIPEKATESELRGEKLFHGKAQCAKCHYGPAFVADYLHDLQVERFYSGRPEGPIKTFPLRGIKDSPPLPPRRPLSHTA